MFADGSLGVRRIWCLGCTVSPCPPPPPAASAPASTDTLPLPSLPIRKHNSCFSLILHWCSRVGLGAPLPPHYHHMPQPVCPVDLVYPVGARLTAVCGAAMCPVALPLALIAVGVRRRGGSMSLLASPCGCRVVPLAVGWYQGHRALLHMSPNLQTDRSLVFVGVVLG